MLKVNSSEIQTHTDLNSYFYEKLEEINLVNLDKTFIFYSSDILSRYAFYTEIASSAALGLELLKASDLGESEKSKVFQNVAEKSLLLSSYFESSLNKKIVGPEYYISLGKTAFYNLDNYCPKYFDIKDFFKSFANHFEIICSMIKKLTVDFKNSIDSQYALNITNIPVQKKAS